MELTEKLNTPGDSAAPKGKTNVWPREGNRSVAEQSGKGRKAEVRNCGRGEFGLRLKNRSGWEYILKNRQIMSIKLE